MSAIATLLATQAAKGIVAAGQNIMSAKRQREEMEHAAKLGFEYNEKAAENAHKRQIQNMGMLYEMNSPENTRKRLEEAGLSVGLMYGGGGAGGSAQSSTAPQGGGAGGVQPVNLSEIKQANTAQMLSNAQADVLKAQAENIKKDTELKDQNIKESESRIDLNKIQGVSQEIIQKNTNLQSEWQEIQNDIARQTSESQVRKSWYDMAIIKAQTNKVLHENEMIKQDVEIKKRTAEAIITQHNLNVEKTAEEILATKANIQLTRQQIQKGIAEITEIYKNIDINWAKIDNNKEFIDEMKRHNIRSEGQNDVKMILDTGFEVADFIKSLIPWAKK